MVVHLSSRLQGFDILLTLGPRVRMGHILGHLEPQGFDSGKTRNGRLEHHAVHPTQFNTVSGGRPQLHG